MILTNLSGTPPFRQKLLYIPKAEKQALTIMNEIRKSYIWSLCISGFLCLQIFFNFIANVLANFSRMTGGARHRRMYVDANADADGKCAKQPGHIQM